MDVKFDPAEMLHQLVKLGDDWADKDAAASLLEETKKSILGRITDELLPLMDSHAAAEKRAFASTEYREHLKHMVEARRDAIKARVRYDGYSAYIELMRTKSANLRAEQKHLGMTT